MAPPLSTEHGAGADAGGAVDLREPYARRAGHLTRAGLAPQLQHDLVDLAQPGRADRLAVGEAAAVRVDRQPAADRGRAALDQRLLLAVLAEPGLGEVHDLGAGLGVLELRDVDVARPEAGELEGRRRGVAGGGRRGLDRDRRAEDLEGAEAAGGGSARTPQGARAGGGRSAP